MVNYFQTLKKETQDYLNSLDFSNAIPKVDGKCLRSNFDIQQEICHVLDVVNYRKPFYEPIPPILRNYRDVDRKSLVKYGRRLLDQIRDGLDIRMCVLDIDGFRFFYKHPKVVDRLISGRVFTLTFEYDVMFEHRKQLSFIPHENLSQVIDQFFSHPGITNKVLLIK